MFKTRKQLDEEILSNARRVLSGEVPPGHVDSNPFHDFLAFAFICMAVIVPTVMAALHLLGY